MSTCPEITEARRWGVDSCMRYALSSLTKFGKDPYNIMRNTGTVWRRWRATIHALMATQQPWTRQSLLSRPQRLYGCPPVGVATGEYCGRHMCRVKQICPWCWCREYVAPLYIRLLKASYPTGKRFYKARSPSSKRRPIKTPFAFTEVYTHTRLPFDDFNITTAYRWMHNSKTYYMDNVFGTKKRDFHGAIWCQTIEPVFRGEDFRRSYHWLVKHRLLIVRDAGADTLPDKLWPAEAALPGTWRKVIHTPYSVKNDLIPIVGRLYKYPDLLMAPDSAEAVAEILGGPAVANFRIGQVNRDPYVFSQRYGILRNSKFDKSSTRVQFSTAKALPEH